MESSVALTAQVNSPLIGVTVALAVLITAAVGGCVPVIASLQKKTNSLTVY